MIGYLEGKLLRRYEDRILLLANQVGYEVLVPAVVMQSINDKPIGQQLALYIYFHQTERQPKPVLIGFQLEAEKEFFQHFISVEAIGPLKAVKALDVPIRHIARAIESSDFNLLKRLPGIGGRTAQKIVASLQGKVEKFALIREMEKGQEPVLGDFMQQVLDVLTNQLGHRSADAKRMISEALNRNPGIASAEALFEEVYRGEAIK
jgi:Holliday junction DNA helicase RuvA